MPIKAWCRQIPGLSLLVEGPAMGRADDAYQNQFSEIGKFGILASVHIRPRDSGLDGVDARHLRF